MAVPAPLRNAELGAPGCGIESLLEDYEYEKQQDYDGKGRESLEVGCTANIGGGREILARGQEQRPGGMEAGISAILST